MEDYVKLEAVVAAQDSEIKALNDRGFTSATVDMTKAQVQEAMAKQQQELADAKKEREVVLTKVAKEAPRIQDRRKLQQELTDKQRELDETNDQLLSPEGLGELQQQILQLSEQEEELKKKLAACQAEQPAVDGAEGEEAGSNMEWSATPEPEDVAS